MNGLKELLGIDRVHTDITSRLAYARDASLYRLVPQAVVRPASVEHIRALFKWCTNHGQHCTFRAGGTSLSGQAVTSGIIVDLARGWGEATILYGGTHVRMQPGITGARVNALLRHTGRKIGPDPASIIAAMIGGIVANNASGMCCGTAQNSYNTLASMEYVLACGTRINTELAYADEILLKENASVHRGIATLRDEIRCNPELVNRIRKKYEIKNTVGYSLNAFLDEDQPARIISKLLIGSEGTLGFLESVTLATVADAREKHTALIVYPSIELACDTVEYWRRCGAAAVEIMDDVSLRSFAHLPHTPDHLRITVEGSAALLVEFHDVVPPSDADVRWTSNPLEQAVLWKLRKGLMPSIGAIRPLGTTMINEDIAVPPMHLSSLIRDVQLTFKEFGYEQAIIFGHAKDGNIHFVVHQRFDTESELQRYGRFMDQIAHIVVDRYNGSLKAEHGTGRNMAPYVEKEWGSAATEIMRRVKTLLDPANILNPGVVLNDNPRIHLENIKPVPVIGQESVEQCIECGFCEHVCPSRNLTLTPRQRIQLQRERVLHAHDSEIVGEIDRSFSYDGIDTCATDGMCSLVCPVGIDTGDMIRQMKQDRKSRFGNWLAGALAQSPLVALRALKVATRVYRKYGTSHSVSPLSQQAPHLIYMQSCPSKIFGQKNGHLALDEVVTTLALRANMRLTTVSKDTICCGQPFSSKGYLQAAETSSNRMLQELASLTRNGTIPVFIDTSTCAAAITAKAREHGIQVLDHVGFASLVMDKINPKPVNEHVVLHPGCGTEKLQNANQMLQLAQRCAVAVVVPPSASCCGMAGDKGIMIPALPKEAIRPEVQEFPEHTTLGISANVMCEYALEKHSNVRFESLLHLVERATRPSDY